MGESFFCKLNAGRVTVNADTVGRLNRRQKVAALAADMQGTTRALGLAADGHYDASGNVFSAERAAVLLSD